jgi:hypothetical protein
MSARSCEPNGLDSRGKLCAVPFGKSAEPVASRRMRTQRINAIGTS